MVQVPVTSRNMVGTTRPEPTQRLRHTQSRDFVGQSVARFGAGLGLAAEDWDAIEGAHDEADAKRIANEYAEFERERLRTGENAYLAKKGFNAGDDREPAYGELQTRSEELLSEARSERARKMAKQVLDQRLGQSETVIAAHSIEQLEIAHNEQSQARISGAITDAIDARGTDQFGIYLGVATMELAEQADRQGWSEDKFEEEQQAMVSNAYSRTVLAIDAEDGEPTAALNFLEEHKELIGPEEEARLKNALTPRVDAAWADELLSSGEIDKYLPAAPKPEKPKKGAPSKVVASGKRGEVSNVLTNAGGLPPAVVAGFLGNFEVEAGYGGARGDGGTASGIAQWRLDRRANFRKQFGKEPHQATMAEQAKFVVWEMNNPGKAGMTIAQRDQILAAKTPEEAARLIDKFYERSNGKHRSKRESEARRFYEGGTAPGTPGVPEDPRLNSQKMRSAVDAYIAANPDMSERRKQALYASADRQVANRRADRAQAEQDADRRLMDWLTQNKPGDDDLTSVSDIPAAVLQGASPSAIAAVTARVQATRSRIEARQQAAAEEAAAKAAAQAKEDAETELILLEGNDFKDENGKPVDLRRFQGRVGKKTLARAMVRQKNLDEGKDQVKFDRFASVLDTYGKDMGASRKPGASEEERRLWTATLGYLQDRFADKADGDVSREDLRAATIAALTEMEDDGTGWFDDDSYRRVDFPTSGKVELDEDLPDGAVEKIRKDLRAMGVSNPSDLEIWTVYQEMKAKGLME